MTETTSEVDRELAASILPFDALDPQYRTYPYPIYQKLREEKGDIFRTPGGMIAVLSHEGCQTVLTDPRLGYGDDPVVKDQFKPNPDGPAGRPLIFMDPPDHTRVRALVSRAFTPRMVEKIRARTRELAVEAFAEARASAVDGVVDLMATFVRPLPGRVLDALIDVPKRYHADFIGMSNLSGRGLDPGFLLTEKEKQQRDEVREGFVSAGMEMARDRRANPGDDLISQLVIAYTEHGKLTEMELGMTLMNVLAAGFNATAGLIGNASLALLRHPEQYKWLRENPDRIVSATEELLRFDSPLQIVPRTAFEELEIGDVTVQPGEHVAAVLGAGNHDPKAYDDPDVLNLARPAGQNLGFGHGIHFCIAAPIARMTAHYALAELVKHDVELTVEEPERFPGMVLRTLGELPVRLSSAA
ncbi:cytochrome P450 [Streptomyces sp.]|uniref:cytochrome P450 n=1 Tax=Streptomyces sp. TaxID=1931 RepID=UPI002F42A646